MTSSTTLLVCLALMVAFAVQAQAGKFPAIVQDTAHDSAGLEHAVKTFTGLLGGKDNGNNPGPIFAGFRNINWDADIVPFDMDGKFFRTEVTRGCELFAKGGEFRVSSDPDGIDDSFDTFNQQYPNIFKTFSPQRLFAPKLKNRVAIKFRVPGINKQLGQDKKAVVVGFGAVFVDVDLFGKTKIIFIDQHNHVIGKFPVLAKNKGLSFFGLALDPHQARRIKKVIIQLGNEKLGVRDSKHLQQDVVVLDDFFYGEPSTEQA